MKILNLLAENVKRISVVEITPDGNLVQVTGPNGSGKTSVLDSIAWALEGAKGIQNLPIRKGEAAARVRLDLGDLVVTRRFTEAGSTLTVESKDGLVYKSPQAVLDRLLGAIAFDPLAFARQKPREQFETLRSLVKIDADLAAIDRENAADFAARTDLNREAKNFRNQAETYGPFPADLPAEKADLSALVDEIAEAGRHNAEIDRAAERRQAALQKAQHLRDRAAQDRRQIERLKDVADRAEAEAAELERKVAEAAPLPERADPAVLRANLAKAERLNQVLDDKAKAERLRTQAENRARVAEEITARMAARDKAKRDAVAAAVMPVPGIGFGDGVVLLNGVPFEQASDAEQLRASCAVAMAANPKLRVLRVRDGSLLDETGLRLLAEMADERDFQIWLEKVDTSGKVGVVLEDGHVKAAEAAHG